MGTEDKGITDLEEDSSLIVRENQWSSEKMSAMDFMRLRILSPFSVNEMDFLLYLPDLDSDKRPESIRLFTMLTEVCPEKPICL